MGIEDPTKTADHQFYASNVITRSLARIIYNQEKDLTNYQIDQVHNEVNMMKAEKEQSLQEELNTIQNSLDYKNKRILELARENGAGAWLTALPIQRLGYTLNKQEFKDAVCLRYGWEIPKTPSYCQCGKRNDVDHALSCPRGGYVIMRHNKIRDLEAELMKEVCHDVKIEPDLLPLANLNRKGNVADKARADVSGVGVWGSHERTFIDVRVMHPNCDTYIDMPLKDVYAHHETLKKNQYNERILQVDKGSFVPVIFSTFGGMGAEATSYHKRIASLISLKKKEEYADVVCYIRTRIRFSLLKSVLMAVRGVRGKSKEIPTAPISTLSFNLLNG